MAKLREAAIALGFETKPLREYEPRDFYAIDSKLKFYWQKKEIDGKEYTLFDKQKFYQDCGALNDKGAVIVENFHWGKTKTGENVARIDEPTKFARAQHLLNWYLWRKGEDTHEKLDYSKVKPLDAPDTDYTLDIPF